VIWYGFIGRVEWCACFVSWCADQCGYIDAGIIPKFAGCITVETGSLIEDNGRITVTFPSLVTSSSLTGMSLVLVKTVNEIMLVS